MLPIASILLVVLTSITGLKLDYVTCQSVAISFADDNNPHSVWIVVNNVGKLAHVDEIADNRQSYTVDIPQVDKSTQFTIDKAVIDGSTYSLPNPKILTCDSDSGSVNDVHKIYIPIVIR